jgi:hypothetical protein
MTSQILMSSFAHGSKGTVHSLRSADFCTDFNWDDLPRLSPALSKVTQMS